MFAQSGGPTSVINAGIAGGILAALKNPSITGVLCAHHGVKGILNEDFFDMRKEDESEILALKNTPASAFGSVRYKLKDYEIDDTDYKRILEVFKKYDVRYFFYNGGNDSMDTCDKVSKYMQKVGYEVNVIGIPKTIDNDLAGTDHCPGYGSAAKYIATSIAEINRDADIYESPLVIVVEIMGRNAGWLTAAASLANACGQGADLIYLPEIDFDMDKFTAKVKEIYAAKKKCLVVVSEGIHDKDGTFIAEYANKNAAKDAFGHTQLGGLAAYLANYIKEQTGAKVRGIELSLLQRCAAHCASQTDIDESFASGKAAVENAVAGVTDKMVGFECTRENGVYSCNTKLFDLTIVANTEKKVPLEWINETGDGLNQGFIDYCLPLIQGETQLTKVNGLPRFVNLKKVKAVAPEA